MADSTPRPSRSSGGSRALRDSGRIRAAVRAEARRWRRLFALSGLLAVLTAAAGLQHGLFGPVRDPEIPRELHGTWLPADPRYAGRELVLQASLVIIGQGDAGAGGTYAVVDVRERAAAGARRYGITYLAGGEKVTLTVLFRPDEPSVLELLHPSGAVWRRSVR